MSPFMAPPGHAGAVRRCPLIGVNRKWLAGGQYDAIDPDWVKTCTRGECPELFSLFSPFDGACQGGSFLIQLNRNERSKRKFEVGVFTQPGSKPEILAASRCFPLLTQNRASMDYEYTP